MSKDLKITPASQSIAIAIEQQMKHMRITPTKLEQALEGRVHKYTVRRIRKGASGCLLRNYEDVLSVLGLKFTIIPITHRDVIDGEYVRQSTKVDSDEKSN